MKTTRSLVPALLIPLILLCNLPLQAGEDIAQHKCKFRQEKPFTMKERVLLPFRAIPWAVYYGARLPGRIIEYSLYGETGEQMAGIPGIAPSLH